MSLDINLTNVQAIPIVVNANITAENNKVYHVIANATFTDPTPVEGRGYFVVVRFASSCVLGGNSYIAGETIHRVFHSGNWLNIAFRPSTYEYITNKKTTLTDNSDTFYPTQKAVKTAVDLKVDVVAGKGLSANDFTNTLKTKLDGIQDGAEVNVNADWNAVSGDAQILNKPTIPSIAGLATETFVTNITDNKVDKVAGSRLITSAESTVLGNTSGTNTGDQDLTNLVVKNSAITGATKTKITYDAKGLVTAGADATTADIADSSNKRYVTDANLTVIGNTSGTNTGDQTLSGLGGVPTTRNITINGKTQDLSADRTFSAVMLNGMPNIANVGTSGATRYFGFSGLAVATSETTRRIIICNNVTVKNFYIYTSTAQPATGSHVLTVLKNGVATSITVTIASGSAAGLFSDTTNSESFAQGDAISIQAVNNATTNSCTIVSLQIGNL